MYKRQLQRRVLRRHYLQLSHAIELQSSPRIFFVPAKHNEKTRALLAATRMAMESKYPEEPEDESDRDENMRDAGVCA